MTARFVFTATMSLLLAGNVVAAFAQGTAADYQRAARLRQLTQNKVFGTSVRPQWLPGNTRLWYSVETGPGKREFILVDADKKERKPAFDHAKLAEALAKALGREVNSQQLPIDRLSF